MPKMLILHGYNHFLNSTLKEIKRFLFIKNMLTCRIALLEGVFFLYICSALKAAKP